MTELLQSTRVSKKAEELPSSDSQVTAPLLGTNFMVLVVVACLLISFSYFGVLWQLSGRWINEPDYSHGFFVPLFSAFLLWHRRQMFTLSPTVSWRAVVSGLALIGIAGVTRWVGIYQQFELLEPVSLIPCISGVVLIIGGWPMARWAWPAVLFLAFMIPLPGIVSGLLSHPLQRVGTIGSTFCLQTIGIPAIAQGNVIYLSEARIGVVEACSGLRMLNVFFAISIGASLIMNRAWWEKAVIILSAPLIGVLTNIFRITVTGIAFEYFSRELAEHLFHDLAGLLMMPVAVGLLMVELALLKALFVEHSSENSSLVVERAGTLNTP